MITKYLMATGKITGQIESVDLFDAAWRSANPSKYHPPKALYDEATEAILAGFYSSEKYYVLAGTPTPKVDSFASASFNMPFVNGAFWVKTFPVQTLIVSGLLAPFTAYVYIVNTPSPISTTTYNSTSYSFTPPQNLKYLISIRSLKMIDIDFYVQGYVGAIP